VGETYPRVSECVARAHYPRKLLHLLQRLPKSSTREHQAHHVSLSQPLLVSPLKSWLISNFPLCPFCSHLWFRVIPECPDMFQTSKCCSISSSVSVPISQFQCLSVDLSRFLCINLWISMASCLDYNILSTWCSQVGTN
jgi:hypothetical protein